MGVNTETDLKTPLRAQFSRAFIIDMLFTLLAAVMTGLSGGVLLILMVFGWSSAQAVPTGETAAGLQLRSLNGHRIEMAPLLNTRVEIDVAGMLAWVKVEQVFSNPSQHWMEGNYQFPLAEGSAVERMRMEIGDRRIEGVIEEKAAAKRIFKQAREAGKKASLLSQQRPNIFTLSATNIAPGEQVRVTIEFQQTVHYSGEEFELRFPMVVAPRYIPKQLSLDEAASISPPVIAEGAGLINPLSMEVRIDAGMPLSQVVSRYHRMVQERKQPGVVHLQLADGEVQADRDMVINWRPKVGSEPELALFREQWQGQDYALLMLMPPASATAAEVLSRELVFIIDRSGSMSGPSMAQAKAALRLAVSRLQPNDRFNLIAFNNRSESLFSNPQSATNTNQQRALAFIDRLRADGGTEMMPALELALNQQAELERLRQIVFLTDGSVGNEQQLFSLIQQKLGESRLFTVGIGSAPNSHFMQRAADFGRGSFSYIGDISEVSSTMQALFAKLENPSMRDIRLDWQGRGELDVEPGRLPDLYLGEPLLLALKGSDLDGQLRVVGERDGALWKRLVDLNQGETQRSGVHALWARQRIKSIMASTSTTTPQQRREAVLRIALEHQLISPYTSLVAVEKTPTRPLHESLKGGDLPVSLPAGWSAQAVFGQLPRTATGAPLNLLLGIALLGLAWITLRFAPRITGRWV
ncbi:MAG: marine proteobacterial sortase target protein [Candidatus Thiodiazotropha taylori]|nr:marine proteobacterial sortase target protein [Candidatus Thiodiazotropha taylori]